MKNSIEKLTETRVKLTVEVPESEFKPAYEKAVKSLAGQVNIPGFRRGKAPRRVIEANFGKGAIIEQAINDNLDNYYQEAVRETEIKPISQPQVSVEEVPAMTGADDSQLKFVVEVDVRPEIILPNPADFTLEVEAAEVSDEDIESELTDLRERFATLTDVERDAAEGDYVNIDMVAKIGDEEVDDVAGVSYQIGDGKMLEGQDEALTGAKAGDVVEFKTKLAGGEHEGEEADVTITVHSVKESILPEADDEFAQLASEFDTIEELKEDLKTSAKKAKEQAQLFGAEQELLTKLADATDFPVPDSLVDEEVANHLRNEGKELDDPHGEEIRDELAEAIRNQFLLDAYAEAFGVEVENEELVQFLVQQAQMYGMDPNQFIQSAAQYNQLGAFSGELARNKALMSAMRLANIVDSKGEKVDVVAHLGEAPENEKVPDFSEKPTKRAAKPKKAEKKAEKPAKDEKPAKAKKAEKADAPAAEFDPADHKVDEVLAYVEEADDAEKARVLEAEKAGKNRKTIVNKLEA